jgi:hypothetical protein
LRAFWSFLARQYNLENSREILASFDDHTVSRLQLKLADPINFGMAKSFFMMGSQAGFDMRTREGLAAFQAIYNAKLASARAEHLPIIQPLAKLSLALPLSERRGGDALKKKRKEKRQQRVAKKRNRPR